MVADLSPGGVQTLVECIRNLEGGGRVVRVTVYLTDLANFAKVNEVMATYFREPYPARAAIGVASLPRGALVEIDAVMHLG